MKTSNTPLPEHSRVRVLRGFEKKGIKAGETGTIVHVHEDGGYEVEFLADRKRPTIVTVESEDVEAVKPLALLRRLCV